MIRRHIANWMAWLSEAQEFGRHFNSIRLAVGIDWFPSLRPSTPRLRHDVVFRGRPWRLKQFALNCFPSSQISWLFMLRLLPVVQSFVFLSPYFHVLSVVDSSHILFSIFFTYYCPFNVVSFDFLFPLLHSIPSFLPAFCLRIFAFVQPSHSLITYFFSPPF
jgi:hypothetical protein